MARTRKLRDGLLPVAEADAGPFGSPPGEREVAQLLESDSTTRARRVADRDGGSAAEQQAVMAAREASEAQRYRDYYNIEIGSREPYSLVINSAALAPKAIVAHIREAL